LENRTFRIALNVQRPALACFNKNSLGYKTLLKGAGIIRGNSGNTLLWLLGIWNEMAAIHGTA
jgi:hypothetical protein